MSLSHTPCGPHPLLMGSGFQSAFPYSLVPTKPGPADSRLYLAPAGPPSARWEWFLPYPGKWQNQVRVKQIQFQPRSTDHSQFSYRVLPILWKKGLPGRAPEGTQCPAHVPGTSLKAAATGMPQLPVLTQNSVTPPLLSWLSAVLVLLTCAVVSWMAGAGRMGYWWKGKAVA